MLAWLKLQLFCTVVGCKTRHQTSVLIRMFHRAAVHSNGSTTRHTSDGIGRKSNENENPKNLRHGLGLVLDCKNDHPSIDGSSHF